MRPVRKADNLPTSYAVVTKSGNLNFLEPSGPLRACNGTVLPLTVALHENLLKFLITSHSVLWMRNFSAKSCKENINAHFIFKNFFFPNIVTFTKSSKTTTHIVQSLNKFFEQPGEGLHTGPKHVVVYYILLLIVILLCSWLYVYIDIYTLHTSCVVT